MALDAARTGSVPFFGQIVHSFRSAVARIVQYRPATYRDHFQSCGKAAFLRITWEKFIHACCRSAVVSFTSLLLLATADMAAEGGGGIPLEAYGVWDRGSSLSFTEYPFLKGLSFGADWEAISP